MSHPKAYSPEKGYQYQILCRHPQYNGTEWEHCDYAEDNTTKSHLLSNYSQAYGTGYQFKTITLPAKYWPPVEKFVATIVKDGKECTVKTEGRTIDGAKARIKKMEKIDISAILFINPITEK